MSAAALAAPEPAAAVYSPLPPEPWHDETKSENVIAVASSAFGVIGTIVGAYFGVGAATRAVGT